MGPPCLPLGSTGCSQPVDRRRNPIRSHAANPTDITELPLDSVVGLESFRTSVDGAATVGLSLLATAGTIGLGVAIACAIDPKCFGSCPTYYSDSAGTPVLEAEGFSYSIAPLFESRDVDRLRARPTGDGTLRLEVRNEAFETHFINHLELLEATHAPGELVAPDPRGHPVAVAEQRSPRAAWDRAVATCGDRSLRPMGSPMPPLRRSWRAFRRRI